ncbi:MAG: crossover junction endodeoxyribonuclease RuvC [Firmicutes bacterium]|nr:crossover junction endodeoxyribonuclease RuvC [Bacillota bacterium]
MRILGIDPGFGIVGFGVIEKSANGLDAIDYGVITTPKELEFSKRLAIISDSIADLIKQFSPDEIAIEELYFSSNVKTAIQVAHARGVIMLECHRAGVPAYEYNPLHIKQAVTGHSKADKPQMQQMAAILLGLAKPPKPDDAADALAIAICHAQTNQVLKRK